MEKDSITREAPYFEDWDKDMYDYEKCAYLAYYRHMRCPCCSRTNKIQRVIDEGFYMFQCFSCGFLRYSAMSMKNESKCERIKGKRHSFEFNNKIFIISHKDEQIPFRVYFLREDLDFLKKAVDRAIKLRDKRK